MRRCLVPAAALAAIAASTASYAQSQIGPKIGVFLPASSELRDAVGARWFSIGLGNVNPDNYTRRKIAPDFNVISGEGNGSKAFIVSYTLGVTQPLGDTFGKSSFRPYIAYRGGLSYIDYAVNTNGGRTSGKRLGYDANAEIGVVFQGNLSLSARYDVVSEHDGLNFNGLSLNLRWGLAKF